MQPPTTTPRPASLAAAATQTETSTSLTALQLRCQNHPDTITDIREPEEFTTLVGDGGCGRACGSLLACGHACLRRCHVEDYPAHRRTRCCQPCDRLHQPCGHVCTKLCHEECGLCTTLVPETLLPCGHVVQGLRCFEAQRAAEVVQCRKMVEVQVRAGGLGQDAAAAELAHAKV